MKTKQNITNTIMQQMPRAGHQVQTTTHRERNQGHSSPQASDINIVSLLHKQTDKICRTTVATTTVIPFTHTAEPKGEPERGYKTSKLGGEGVKVSSGTSLNTRKLWSSVGTGSCWTTAVLISSSGPRTDRTCSRHRWERLGTEAGGKEGDG